MAALNLNGRLVQIIIAVAFIVGGLVAGYYMQQAELAASMNEKYYSKEVMDAKMKMICYRLDKIEQTMQGVDGKLDRLLEQEQ